MKKLLLLMCGLFIGVMANAQTIVSGTVVDDAEQPLVGASVVVPGTTQGTSTDLGGNFEMKLRDGASQIQISYLNYKTQTLDVDTKVPRQKFGMIKMESDAIAMDDVVITQSLAVQRRTPVAVSTVEASEIEFKLGGQEFPEVLKSTPGVYVTKDGGGYLSAGPS